MTDVAAPMPIGANRVRIGITSPDILAQIRQVFASKNLAVEIISMPYVEVTVRPAATDRYVRGTALEQRNGARSGLRAPASRRLCAEYRLNVVEVTAPPGAGAPGLTPEVSAPDGPAAALSRRQHEVMTLVSRGVRNAEIAARLQVSEKTVKNHVNRIFRQLGAGSRVEAVLIWQRRQREGAANRRDAPGPPLVPTGDRRPRRGGNP